MSTDTIARDREFELIVDELTRRGFLAGLGTVAGSAALLGLSACDGDSSDAPPPPSSTRSVATAMGTVRVPADPKRVVAIQPSALATLLDVGRSVVGAYDQGAEYISPRYRSSWQAAPKIGTAGQIDVEKVAALQPDLIVGVDYEWNTNVYRQLEQVAPTVIAPSTGWQGTARTVADAVGQARKLATLAARLRQRGAQLRQQYSAVLTRYRWDILQGGFDEGQYWLYGPGSDIGQVLGAAGVRFAAGTARTPGDGNRAFSYEHIDVLADADVLGYYANFDGTPNNEAPQLFAQSGFKALPAAKAHQLVPLPDFLPGGYGDALAALDELEAGLKRLPEPRA